jgi:tRNA U34 5-methylaminomethyl-2-thiouridine-forming methyltransferase MnmC
MERKVETADGSVTLFSEKFREPYHSLTAGAFTEAIEKFCKPCKVREKAKKGEVRLLDVCFGLGYNSVAFINEVFSENPSAKVKLVGFEFNLRIVEESLRLDWKSFNRWKWILRSLLMNKRCESGVLTLNFAYPKLEVKVFITEGRNFLKKFSKKYENFFDFVFHDPFSPKVNPELWTYEFFKGIRKVIKENGILATYSSSTAVRRALHMAGFGVKEGVSVGRKSKSTVASPSYKTQSEILEKFKFPTSIPFRDPKLSDPPDLIKNRRNGCIRLQNKYPLEVFY